MLGFGWIPKQTNLNELDSRWVQVEYQTTWFNLQPYKQITIYSGQSNETDGKLEKLSLIPSLQYPFLKKKYIEVNK